MLGEVEGLPEGLVRPIPCPGGVGFVLPAAVGATVVVPELGVELERGVLVATLRPLPDVGD